MGVCVLSLLQESGHKEAPYETRVLKDESDPMFQEQFVFYSINKIEDKTLIFRVWHFDRIAVENPPIGELALGKSGMVRR